MLLAKHTLPNKKQQTRANTSALNYTGPPINLHSPCKSRLYVNLQTPVCMYVCLSVCTYVYTYMHAPSIYILHTRRKTTYALHICICIYVYIDTYRYTYTYIHANECITCIYTSMHTDIQKHDIYMHMHMHIYVHLHLHVHIHTHLHVHTPMHEHINVVQIAMHIHINIHTYAHEYDSMCIRTRYIYIHIMYKDSYTTGNKHIYMNMNVHLSNRKGIQAPIPPQATSTPTCKGWQEPLQEEPPEIQTLTDPIDYKQATQNGPCSHVCALHEAQAALD